MKKNFDPTQISGKLVLKFTNLHPNLWSGERLSALFFHLVDIPNLKQETVEQWKERNLHIIGLEAWFYIWTSILRWGSLNSSGSMDYFVAETGGYVGLFLGFSILEMRIVVEFVWRKLSLYEKETKK
jgi:hypothetical protein